MIKRSIAAAVAILVTYQLLLPHLSHKFYSILGQQRGNYLQEQRYVLDAESTANVVVGSSISHELDDDQLGGYFKLTLPGGSLFTGLETIRRTGKHPRVVLIETNVLMRDADDELLHDLFTPSLLTLRRHFSMFREDGRPSNFAAGVAAACVRKCTTLATALVSRPAPTNPASPPDRLDPALLSQLIHSTQEESRHPPAASELSMRVERLGRFVDELSRRGCRCVFFEMPVDATLSGLPLQSAQRQAVALRFPRPRYDWVDFEQSHYETVDGTHLTHEEATRVTRRLLEAVGAITARQPAENKPGTHS